MPNVIDDLRNARVKDDTTLDSLVIALYGSCLKMIKFKNKGGLTDMVFEIPVIHIGFPLYNQEEVSLKFNKYLKKQGFKTIYYPINKIYIKW